MVLSSDIPPEKSLHPWAQSITEAFYYVETLTQPGDIVADVFGGTGTTAEASFRLGRRFCGTEIEKETYEIAFGRLSKCIKTSEEPVPENVISYEDV